MDASETVSVPGTPAGLRSAADAAVAFSARYGVPDRVRHGVLTALDEVLSNIVRYGLQGHGGSIDVVMRRDDDRVVVEISDSAVAFNPLRAPAPDTTAPLDTRRVGGLGIALVRALTDEVRYERRSGRNHLTLTWRCGSKAPEDGHAD